MVDNVEKVNDELESVEKQVNNDIVGIDEFKKQKTHFIQKIASDRKKKKITTKQYFNYKKEAKKILDQNLNQLKSGLTTDLTEFNAKYNQSLEANNQAVKEGKKKFFQITPKFFVIIVLIIVPIFMVIGLTLNYLIVSPPDFSDQNAIIGFSISMVILVIDLIFLVFICKITPPKMMMDRYNNAAKIIPIGFIANFFDILGIGSFATTTNLLKVTKSIKDDKKLPGTLNTGLAVANLFSGCLFIGVVQVEMTTLIPFVVCTIIGSFIGSRIVNKINTRAIQLIMGIVLGCTAIIMLMTVRGIAVLPSGTLKGVFAIWWKFVIGCLAFVILGIFLSFGIGLYAPAMAIISLLGIDFLVVFPIMTVSAGLSMHINAYRYSLNNNYLPKTSFCLTIGGIIGDIVAFSLIFVGLGKGLGVSTNDIKAIFQWISVFVIAYASFLLIWSFIKQHKKNKNQPKKKGVAQVIATIDYKNFDRFVTNWSNNLMKNISIKSKNIHV